MAYPHSATPARLAVLAAMTTVTGATRDIPTASLFKRQATNTETARAATLKGNKRVLVIFQDPRSRPGEMEFGTRMLTDYTVQIRCSYYAGSDLFSEESDKALTLIETDEPLVRAALCAPGALATSPAGAAYPYNVDTGLVGGALLTDGYRVDGPVPAQGEDGERRFVVTHWFTATIDILQPT